MTNRDYIFVFFFTLVFLCNKNMFIQETQQHQ